MGFSIFHLTASEASGDAERQLLYLISYLKSKGHKNTVVCKKDAPVQALAAARGVEVANLPFHGQWGFWSGFKMRGLVGSASPAILHAHCPISAAVGYHASRANLPYIVEHRSEQPLPNALLKKFKNATAILPASDAVKSQLLLQDMPFTRVKLVRDGVPTLVAEAQLVGQEVPVGPSSEGERKGIRAKITSEWDVPEGAWWIGLMGDLDCAEDAEAALAAMATVRKEVDRAQMLVVGDGPLKARLEAKAKSLGVSYSVRFVGQPANRLEWLQALDYFIPASGTVPLTLLMEAAACRVPIVCPSACGMAEIARNDQTGRNFLRQNANSLAQALLTLLRDPTIGERLAANNYQRRAELSLTRYWQQIEKIYEETIASLPK